MALRPSDLLGTGLGCMGCPDRGVSGCGGCHGHGLGSLMDTVNSGMAKASDDDKVYMETASGDQIVTSLATLNAPKKEEPGVLDSIGSGLKKVFGGAAEGVIKTASDPGVQSALLAAALAKKQKTPNVVVKKESAGMPWWGWLLLAGGGATVLVLATRRSNPPRFIRKIPLLRSNGRRARGTGGRGR
jgi:hypothetical protein